MFGVEYKDVKRPFSFWMSKPVMNFIMVLLGMTAAYFTTIGSIKIQLAEKAESVLVEAIDRKLAAIEVTIREGRVSKDEFYQLKSDIEGRLIRIEYYLKESGR